MSRRKWGLNREARRLAVRLAAPLAFLVLVLVFWQLYTTIAGVPSYLVPAPSAIWQSSVSERDVLLSDTLPTLQIIVLGFLAALVAGVVLALAIHFSRLLELALYPIVIVSQTVPVVAIAPILVVVLGFTILPKLIVVCLVCLFPIVVNTVDGFRGVDRDLVNLMRTLGAGRLRIFREVEWPTALPYLFSGMKVAATYSVVGALYGEWVGSSSGLGYLMTQKMAQFDTAIIFAALVILSVIGIAFFGLIVTLQRVLMPWYRGDNRGSIAGGPRQ